MGHYYQSGGLKMSCIQNEMILETIFEEVQECFPFLTEEAQIELATKRFEESAQ